MLSGDGHGTEGEPPHARRTEGPLHHVHVPSRRYRRKKNSFQASIRTSTACISSEPAAFLHCHAEQPTTTTANALGYLYRVEGTVRSTGELTGASRQLICAWTCRTTTGSQGKSRVVTAGGSHSHCQESPGSKGLMPLTGIGGPSGISIEITRLPEGQN